MQKDREPQDQELLLKEITRLLQRSKVPYMVTGALSVIFYGRPRASHDIDFVIEAKKEDIEKIKEAFAVLSHDFLVQKDQIEEAIIQGLSFNILHLPTMLKLDFFLLKDDEFDRSRFRRRKTLNVFGQIMTFASPEDTI
ncbi:MAG: nucleotidyl transferase AbiEii/AbiGii toxin family protein [Candidatus Levybacteria bacterium]|nr:nucleotidyl transferase AbiEii/AbiGii toxin family protein [Candidatus Levybacteria bacterium]